MTRSAAGRPPETPEIYQLLRIGSGRMEGAGRIEVRNPAAANATEYGLAAYLFTQSLGGVKQSGLRLEGGPEGLEEFTVSKFVSVRSR